MLVALQYLVQRFFYRIWEFIAHWYVHGFLLFGKYTVNLLASLDQTIALRITLRYFFEPLYGDYTAIGRIFGVVFRSGRVLVGSLIYIVIAGAALGLYIIWALIPPFILSHILWK